MEQQQSSGGGGRKPWAAYNIIDRGEGIYVYDSNGKRYIEGMAGLWSTSLGFSEQRLIDAATRQLAKRQFTWLRATSAAVFDPTAPRLVEAVVAHIERQGTPGRASAVQ